MIDKDTFNMTYGDFGKEAITEIVNIYIDEHEERLKTIKNNIEKNNLKELGENAHSLKGATASLFDNETADNCKKLEMKAKNNDSSGLGEIYSELEKNVLKLVDDLEQMKKEL